MKSKSFILFAVVVIFALTLFGCSNNSEPSAIDAEVSNVVLEDNDIITQESEISASENNDEPLPKSSGKIYLYGERHGVKEIMDREIELWGEYYSKHGMRHLLIEMPYYTAEYLNLWMQSDSNEILDEIYGDWAGTPSQNPSVKEFYETIKIQYPETIFHGTDVGHQYATIGRRYFSYLIANDLEDTEEYRLTVDNMNQGKYYYKNNDHEYRENMMVENFIREFDKLDGESIMGIYGGAHTGLDSMDFYNTVACMATQLKERYGDNIYSEDLSNEPIRIDTIKVEGKTYEASYFGSKEVTGFKDYKEFEYWRLENAYVDFKDNPKNGDVLPYNNYPISIEAGQVYILGITKTDGSYVQWFYRSDGNEWNDMLTTEGFVVE